MTKEYSEALGFTNAQYGEGKHRGEKPYNQILYQNIDVALRFVITFTHDEPHTVMVKEPSPADVVDLISEINKALVDYKLSFVYDGINLEFQSERGHGYRCKLSPLLEKIFGVPADTWFHLTEQIIKSYPDISLEISSDFLIVFCNVAEPQFFNGHMLPYLKINKSSANYNKRVHVECDPVLYFPLVSDANISTIHIQLLDETLKNITVNSDSDSIVVLHVRTKLI